MSKSSDPVRQLRKRIAARRQDAAFWQRKVGEAFNNNKPQDAAVFQRAADKATKDADDLERRWKLGKPKEAYKPLTFRPVIKNTLDNIYDPTALDNPS